ncbi:MAG: nitroreductase family protein, partial [Ignavibacteria bacterium]|nr:nitroreductase family protein [Ignavibacteria bacterium]
RSSIAELLDNPKHIIEAPLYFVFVADLSRQEQIAHMHSLEMGSLQSEALLIATVDTTLAAQNMMIAAESLGLGGVYTGVLRNYPEEISKILNLPDKSFALFGLCLGYPSKVNEVKPRLQIEEVLHINLYNTAKSIENLAKYDKEMEAYYLNRSSNTKTELWTDQMAHYFSNTLRPHMNSFLSSKGFKLK